MRLGGLWLDPADAVILDAHAPRIRRSWTVHGLPVPRDLDVLLSALGSVAAGAREAAAAASGAAGSGLVPSAATDGSDARYSLWPTTTAAAKEIGCSPRALTKAIDAGRLRAIRDRRGHWRLNPDDLRTYEPRSARGPRAGSTADRLAADLPR